MYINLSMYGPSWWYVCCHVPFVCRTTGVSWVSHFNFYSRSFHLESMLSLKCYIKMYYYYYLYVVCYNKINFLYYICLSVLIKLSESFICYVFHESVQFILEPFHLSYFTSWKNCFKNLSLLPFLVFTFHYIVFNCRINLMLF